MKLFLAALPESGAVVEVEGDESAVCLGSLGGGEAELGGGAGHGGDEAGDVEDGHALRAENAVKIELVSAQGRAHLAGAVVPHPGSAHTEAGIGNVELMAIAPRAALIHLNALVVDVAAAQVVLNELGNGAALDELGQHQALVTQRRCHVQHVGLGGSGLHVEVVAVVDSHTVVGGDANAHAGGASDGIAVVAAQIQFHSGSILSRICEFFVPFLISMVLLYPMRKNNGIAYSPNQYCKLAHLVLQCAKKRRR